MRKHFFKRNSLAVFSPRLALSFATAKPPEKERSSKADYQTNGNSYALRRTAAAAADNRTVCPERGWRPHGPDDHESDEEGYKLWQGPADMQPLDGRHEAAAEGQFGVTKQAEWTCEDRNGEKHQHRTQPERGWEPQRRHLSNNTHASEHIGTA